MAYGSRNPYPIMESPTPFDLNAAIQTWRRQADVESLPGDALDELESHLREAVLDLQSRGLTPAEAFGIACERLGAQEPLGQEFAKVHPTNVWRRRVVWMLAGMLVLKLTTSLSHFAGSAALLLAHELGATGLSAGWLAVLGRFALLTAATLALGSLVRGRLGSLSAQGLLRRPLAVLALGVGAILFTRFVGVAVELAISRQLGTTTLAQAYSVVGVWGEFDSVAGGLLIIGGLAWLLTGNRLPRAGTATGLACLTALWVATYPVTANAQTSPAAPAPAAPTQPASPAGSLGQALKLWTEAKRPQAVAEFLTVDFAQRPLFPKGSILNYTEKQFIDLPNAAREKLAQQMIDDLQKLKQLAASVRKEGQTAQEAGDTARAELCSAQIRRCGQALDHPDSLALLRLVGQALQKPARPEPRK
jgi:hypothetical protein